MCLALKFDSCENKESTNENEKGITESKLKDRYDQVVFVDEPYFKEKNLQKIRSGNNSIFQRLSYIQIQFIYNQVYQLFVEIEQNLTITKELYLTIVSQF